MTPPRVRWRAAGRNSKLPARRQRDANAQIFSQVRSQIDSTYALARQGDSSASTRAFDAYMTFEQVERAVRAKNPSLAAELETAFAALRTRAAGGATPTELDAIRRQLDAGLENAERTLGDDLSPANLFFQSFVIMVREGLEAILIVGALMTFLVKMGAAHRKRDINIGVGAAVGASLLTAFALETIFHLTPAKREALEGAHDGGGHGRALLRELLAAVEDGSGQVEPLREEQGAGCADQRLVTGACLGRLSRGLPRGLRDGPVLQGAVLSPAGPGGSGMPIVAGYAGRRRSCWWGSISPSAGSGCGFR